MVSWRRTANWTTYAVRWRAQLYIITYRRVNNIFPRVNLRGSIDFAATAQGGTGNENALDDSRTICAADREKGTVGRIAGGYPGYQNGQ